MINAAQSSVHKYLQIFEIPIRDAGRGLIYERIAQRDEGANKNATGQVACSLRATNS